MTAYFERVQLLLQQSRYDMAEEQLRLWLAEQPDSAAAHSLLAIALSGQSKFRAAVHEAEKGIVLAPDIAYSYYVLAAIQHDADALGPATEAIDRAIQLDPFDADQFGLKASILLQQKEWKQALEAAEKALEIDAENVSAANTRAMALVKLGRRSEAGVTIDSALARDPENAVTHANQGWTKLEAGDHNGAMDNFKEALRLDPNLDWAREGIVESLKARNPIYRVMLRYFFWMSRLKSKIQWLIIIGAVVGIRIVNNLMESNPEFVPFGWTIIILYLAFVILTWIADPIFELLLRLNKFGRLALSDDQITASNLVGGALLLAIVFLLAGLFTANNTLYVGAAFTAALIVPLSGIYRPSAKRSRLILGIYAGILTFLVLAGTALNVAEINLGNLLHWGAFIGIILYSWVANWLIIRG